MVVRTDHQSRGSLFCTVVPSDHRFASDGLGRFVIHSLPRCESRLIQLRSANTTARQPVDGMCSCTIRAHDLNTQTKRIDPGHETALENCVSKQLVKRESDLLQATELITAYDRKCREIEFRIKTAIVDE